MWRRRRLRPLLVTVPAVIGLVVGVPLAHAVTTTAAAANYECDHPAASAQWTALVLWTRRAALLLFMRFAARAAHTLSKPRAASISARS